MVKHIPKMPFVHLTPGIFVNFNVLLFVHLENFVFFSSVIFLEYKFPMLVSQQGEFCPVGQGHTVWMEHYFEDGHCIS